MKAPQQLEAFSESQALLKSGRTTSTKYASDSSSEHRPNFRHDLGNWISIRSLASTPADCYERSAIAGNLGSVLLSAAKYASHCNLKCVTNLDATDEATRVTRRIRFMAETK